MLADAFADSPWTDWTVDGDRHEPARAAAAAAAYLHPTEAHYYLGAVGVRRDRRRCGLGTAVLQPVLERVQAEGASAYLETSTPENVDFYTRLGFAITGEVQILDEGPNIWAMMRR